MKKKILIVDDEKFVTDALEGFFHIMGYEIFKAEDGETTLDIIKNERLDLVLLDIKLPKIDGIEILKLLRKDYPLVRVIIMTAYDIEYKSKIDEIGCDAFFIKPLLIDELTKEVEKLLSLPGPASCAVKQPTVNIEQTQEKLSSFSPTDRVPEARILIVSPRSLISDLLKEYFSQRELCKGIFEVSESSLEQLGYIKKFQPDIILLDIALVGMLGEFGVTLMKLPHPPKEIVLFGDPAVKWEEVESLVKRGTRFVEIPVDLYSKEYPIKDTIERLSNALRDVCVKYGLFHKEVT